MGNIVAININIPFSGFGSASGSTATASTGKSTGVWTVKFPLVLLVLGTGKLVVLVLVGSVTVSIGYDDYSPLIHTGVYMYVAHST